MCLVVENKKYQTCQHINAYQQPKNPWECEVPWSNLNSLPIIHPFPFRHEWVPRLAEAMIFIATRDLDEGEELCPMASTHGEVGLGWEYMHIHWMWPPPCNSGK